MTDWHTHTHTTQTISVYAIKITCLLAYSDKPVKLVTQTRRQGKSTTILLQSQQHKPQYRHSVHTKSKVFIIYSFTTVLLHLTEKWRSITTNFSKAIVREIQVKDERYLIKCSILYWSSYKLQKKFKRRTKNSPLTIKKLWLLNT